ncbi:hypothetical protein UFOVP1290_186 [uncultured Caudovirales phage]|uniref:Uncharacterized protein n=1 Tax=uncultured Caudovirales phage TaxID=2100421 RepID=A0A6J5RQU8_9CAUD|nr:hypothetical protein UFOVP1290_186 [uncultured Caudovirales phage]
MRIISSFFDYYDKGLAFGIDPNLVYVRETKILKAGYGEPGANNSLVGMLRSIALSEKNHRLSHAVIGFCGKAYPMFRVSFGNKKTKNYYSFDSIQNDLDNGIFVDKYPYTSYELHNVMQKTVDRQYAKYDRLQLGCKDITDKIFREYKAPVLLADYEGYSPRFTINPRLNEYNFITQVDPIAAFQELAMFVGNNLVDQKDPNPKLSDDIKRDIHGFDKFSFRKGKKGK